MSANLRIIRLATIALLVSAIVARADSPYLLGPLDQLQVKVSDLRAGTGEAYQWQAFDGIFAVNASGKVALPVVGEIDANGRTTSDIASDIAERLKVKAGLATKPDASVQIVKFRPFYVMGSVEKPGEFEFRPGLTVLQGVSLAGGLQRIPTDVLLQFVRDAVQSRGEIKSLSATRFAMIARQARLDAEIKDIPLVFPPEIETHSQDPEIARILREERLALDTRRSAIKAQIDNLTKNKTYLTEQIASLSSKDLANGEQLDIMKQEYVRISALVSKGLSAMPRQIETSQAIATLEASRLDVQIAIIRARQDISKADRDILDLRDQRRNTALQDLAETRIKLNETTARMETAKNLLYQAEIRSPATIVANAEAYSKPRYVILRRHDGKSEQIEANEEDLLQPGDVIRVQPHLTNAMKSTIPEISAGAARASGVSVNDF